MRGLSGLSGLSGLVGGLTYLLRDDFTTDAVAPLSSPRTAEPGPGTLTLTDTLNRLSVASGELSKAGADNVGWTDPRVVTTSSYARLAGRALLFNLNQVSSNQVMGGWHTNNSGGSSGKYQIYPTGAGTVRVRLGGTDFQVSSVNALGTSYQYALILCSTGCFFFRKESGIWTLLWVDNAGADTPLWGHIVSGGSDWKADNLRVLDLPQIHPAWSDSYGIATQRIAGAVSAGQTFTHEANGILVWTQTAVPSADGTRVRFRVQDSANYWLITINASGNIALNEVVAGVSTQRAAVGAVVASGHRIVVIFDGTTIRGYSNNVLRWTYSSASNFQSATSGEVNTLGTGGAVSDVVAYPRDVSQFLAGLS